MSQQVTALSLNVDIARANQMEYVTPHHFDRRSIPPLLGYFKRGRCGGLQQ